MDLNQFIRYFLALLCLTGGAWAISNVSVNSSPLARWNGSGLSAGVPSEGGNITMVDINSVSLTDHWMGFFGNVLGNIVLGNNLAYMYNWSWTSGGGEVCVAQNSSFDFSSVNSTSANSINSAWDFGSISDNAINTYNRPTCNLTVNQKPVNNTASAKHSLNSTFITCAISRGISNTNKTDFAYCAGINSGGRNYLNQPMHYELLVPSEAGPAPNTYYFFAELD